MREGGYRKPPLERFLTGAALVWTVVAFGIACFARLIAICPVNEPSRSWCHAQANTEVLAFFCYLLVPSGALLLVAALLSLARES